MTFAEFFMVELPTSKMDLERCIAIILGNLVMRLCFAIFLFGANLRSGNSISSIPPSGLVSIACWIFLMAAADFSLKLSEVEDANSC